MGFNQHNPLGDLPEAFPDADAGDPLRRQVEQYILAFDSNLFPIVGQGITLSAKNGAAAGPRIDLLEARALLGECDLIAKGRVGGEPRGYLLTSSGRFAQDRAGAPGLSDGDLRALAARKAQEITYTCVPPGGGLRAGLDRDLDGALDGDE